MPSRESRRVASALPGAAALLISAWCWTAIPAAAKVRRNAPKTGHSGPLLMDGPVRENCSVTVFWDLDNLMPCSNVSLRSYCRALARRFVGPAQFRLYANMRTRERLYLAQGSGAEPRFCFDDAPKIEFDGTDNIPSNADDLLSIVQGRPNALAVAVSKRDQQKLRSWAKATKTEPATRSDGCSTIGGPTWRPSTRRSRWFRPPFRAQTRRFTTLC